MTERSCGAVGSCRLAHLLPLSSSLQPQTAPELCCPWTTTHHYCPQHQPAQSSLHSTMCSRAATQLQNIIHISQPFHALCKYTPLFTSNQSHLKSITSPLYESRRASCQFSPYTHSLSCSKQSSVFSNSHPRKCYCVVKEPACANVLSPVHPLVQSNALGTLHSRHMRCCNCSYTCETCQAAPSARTVLYTTVPPMVPLFCLNTTGYSEQNNPPL